MMIRSHLSLIPDAKPDAPCVVCHRTDVDGQCERCGCALCMDCFVNSVASEAERDRLFTVDMGAPGVNPVLFLCRGCRS